MTAALPRPEKEPEKAVTSRESSLPPKPTVPAAQAASDRAEATPPRPPMPAPPAKRPTPRAPTPRASAPRTPRKKKVAPARAVPPKPDVPADIAAAQFAEHEAPVVDDSDVLELPAEPDVEPEPETVPEPEPEPEPELDPVPEPEPQLEPEPEPQPEVASEPEVDGNLSVAPVSHADVDALPDMDIDTAVTALRVRGISKSFGQTRAVDNVDLTIPAGTFYGIVGPNGAGKTTTLSMIAGLLRPDRGTIEVAGIDLRTSPARAKRQMGILPDRLRTFDRLTGRQLLHYYGTLRGVKSAVVESRTADLARAFDLTEALGRPVADYSAGMTKKVMLAGAMIHSPRVLVLDEPFEAVDPVSSSVILDILSAYTSHGGTVILSSHGMELVERVCSGVAVIVAGQVLAAGTVAEVRGELTLEQRFIELAGGSNDVEGLEWLHTFSG